ncbi:peptidoglycan-binding protein [Actinomadura sp. 6N118]|uniref:peptidoglycan-binding protein n=1 Tax=Actinomadura sp. 6N118 TaxID=3375151 RepID=UPI00378E4796
MAEVVRDTVPPPDPGAARTVPQFMECLRELKQWSGLTYRQLERQAIRRGRYLPHSTIAGALSRNRLPRRELLIDFVTACGCPPDEVARWTAARAALDAGANPSVAIDHPKVAENTDSPQPLEPKPRLSARPVNRERSIAVLMAVAVVVATAAASAPAVSSGPRQAALLDRCPEPMTLGTRGTCVQDLQRHLQRHGLNLPADGWYGPLTKSRVTAFQVFAGLPPSAMVDATTKRAVLTRRSEPIPSWTRPQAARRIREVFTAAPAGAVALAWCLSYLDSLQVIGDRYGVRRWGLFQLSDTELLELGGSPITALHAEWNIQAAHTIWKRTKTFRNWKCKSATDDSNL